MKKQELGARVDYKKMTPEELGEISKHSQCIERVIQSHLF